MKLPITSCHFHGDMFKLSAKFDADSLLYSVILNVMVTQYTWSLNGVYCCHWLVQWSLHCSSMHIPIHSPWLPGYISIIQAVLVILRMAGLFPDRPHISKSGFMGSYHKPTLLLKETPDYFPKCEILHYQKYLRVLIYLHPQNTYYYLTLIIAILWV